MKKLLTHQYLPFTQSLSKLLNSNITQQPIHNFVSSILNQSSTYFTSHLLTLWHTQFYTSQSFSLDSFFFNHPINLPTNLLHSIQSHTHSVTYSIQFCLVYLLNHPLQNTQNTTHFMTYTQFFVQSAIQTPNQFTTVFMRFCRIDSQTPDLTLIAFQIFQILFFQNSATICYNFQEGDTFRSFECRLFTLNFSLCLKAKRSAFYIYRILVEWGLKGARKEASMRK